MRLYGPDTHEPPVLGPVGLVEVSSRVEDVVAPGFPPHDRTVGKEPGPDVGGALHHVAVNHLQEEVAQVEGGQHLALA